MLLFEEDVQALAKLSGSYPSSLARTFVNTAVGSGELPVVLIEAIFFHGRGQTVRWTQIACYAAPGAARAGYPRLSGIWLRHLLWHLSRPDLEGELIIGDNLSRVEIIMDWASQRARPDAPYPSRYPGYWV